jgi:hypothetical protein
MEHNLLEGLNRILRQGICDLNEAAKRLRVPVSVVQRVFADGLLKGYWRIADGQLLIEVSADAPPKRPSASPGGDGSKRVTAA